MKTEPKARIPKSAGTDVTGEFAQFTDFMRRLVKVPHSQIKARLEEEKKAKKQRVSRAPAV
jgi:hypothetical protein